MSVQDLWAELLGRVEQVKGKSKERESTVSADEAKALVRLALASPEDRAFFVSKLAKPDELSRRRVILAATVEVVRNHEQTSGWSPAERNDLLCHLTDLIGKAPNWAERRTLLWQATASWCRTRDLRIQREVGDRLKEKAGVIEPKLRVALRDSEGWDQLTKEEQVEVLIAVKDRWPPELRFQAEEMITALRALPTPPPRPAPPPVVPPPPVEPATPTADTGGPATEPALPGDPLPVPPPPTHGPTKPAKRKPEATGGEPVGPLVDGLKGLVQSLNDIVRGQMNVLAERVARLEQSASDTARAELDRVRVMLEAEQELAAGERARAQQLGSELSKVRQRAETAERELTAARKEIEHAAAAAEQEVHTARVQAEAAVNGFRARLWGDLGPLVTQASEAEFVDRAKTPEEKIVRKWLKAIYESLRAAGVTPQSPT